MARAAYTYPNHFQNASPIAETGLSRPKMRDRTDILRSYLENDNKFATEANLRAVQVQHEIAKEKTQYFEKIAITAGGTIALVVSFVGARSSTHSGGLNPPWLLRSALVALVLTMITAMARNWRYPYYLHALYNRQYLDARLKAAMSKRDLVTSEPTPLEAETGRPFDVPKYLTEFKEHEGTFNSQIAACKRQEDSALWQTTWLEHISLTLILASMALLVILAWKNF